jgi:hypothetical protein
MESCADEQDVAKDYQLDSEIACNGQAGISTFLTVGVVHSHVGPNLHFS